MSTSNAPSTAALSSATERLAALPWPLTGPPFVIAEIGINHNGDVEIAKELIRAAREAGCDAVKFQKRTIDIVYPPELLAQPRVSPWGTTQRTGEGENLMARPNTTSSTPIAASRASPGSPRPGTCPA